MKKEILFIFIIIIFLLFVEFVLFIHIPDKCYNKESLKEGFDKSCIGPNIIHLTDILLDKMFSNTKIELINKINFTTSESGDFKPILDAKVKQPNGKSIDLDSDTKIEYIKQKIIKTYILNCSSSNYTSNSQIQDIKYLKSSNPDIQRILSSKDDPSHQVLDIATLLNSYANHYL
jgi:hypothetical protein